MSSSLNINVPATITSIAGQPSLSSLTGLPSSLVVADTNSAANISVQLVAANNAASLSASATGGASLVSSGNTLQISGTTAQVNAALATLSFAEPSGVTSDTISLSATDNTGTIAQSGFFRHNPPMGLLNNPVAFAEAARFAASAKARFVFFALGSPVQELLAQEVLRQGQAVGLGLCIGAAVEFAAGTRRRAPAWMQRAGLEWLHRLCQEPRRLGPRYLLRAPRVLVLLLAEAAGFRAGSSG